MVTVNSQYAVLRSDHFHDRVLETIQVILAMYFIDKYLIENFGVIDALEMMEWCVIFVLSCISACV